MDILAREEKIFSLFYLGKNVQEQSILVDNVSTSLASVMDSF